MSITEAKNKSLKDVLAQYGYSPERETGSYLMYKSPLRYESDASFALRISDGKWKDFGLFKPGEPWKDVIDFIQRYEECDISAAINILTGGDFKKLDRQVIREKKKRIVVVEPEEREITGKHLTNYLRYNRKLDMDIVKKYCYEAHIKFPYSKRNPDGIHKVLAFRNSVGSFSYRNEYLKGSGERNSYAFVPGNGTHSIIFEGFISFLSMLTHKKTDKVKEDVYVLNSAVNVLYLELKLKDYVMNYGCLDNDLTGDNYTQWIIDTGAPFTDMRYKYFNYNDFNDFLCGRNKIRASIFKFIFR